LENRRWGVAVLKDKERKFLDDNPFIGVVTDLREDGSPHSTPVWVDVEDGKISFNTAYGRAKPRNLEKDPRVALIVTDPEDPYKWVSITGRAELTEQGADEQIDKLAKKYLGKDEYPWRKPEEKRVKVLIEPQTVESRGVAE
jgi:PPOX class probable F420-dependent enzyme